MLPFKILFDFVSVSWANYSDTGGSLRLLFLPGKVDTDYILEIFVMLGIELRLL